jgi:hypothetical protein
MTDITTTGPEIGPGAILRLATILSESHRWALEIARRYQSLGPAGLQQAVETLGTESGR